MNDVVTVAVKQAQIVDGNAPLSKFVVSRCPLLAKFTGAQLSDGLRQTGHTHGLKSTVKRTNRVSFNIYKEMAWPIYKV